MIGFGIFMLIYLAAVLAAWYVALVGGMFLQRAGFKRAFGENPGYVMLTVAVGLGLLASITNPSVYLGFGNAPGAIFTGFIAALIGILLVAAIGYLLSPERISKYYDRTLRLLDDGVAPPKPRTTPIKQEVSGDKPETETPPVSEPEKS